MCIAPARAREGAATRGADLPKRSAPPAAADVRETPQIAIRATSTPRDSLLYWIKSTDCESAGLEDDKDEVNCICQKIM